MPKENTKFQRNEAIVIIITLLIGIALGSSGTIALYWRAKDIIAAAHLRTMVNKNCNDCHVGQSWVKILNNSVVQGSKANGAPLVDDILTKARVKVY